MQEMKTKEQKHGYHKKFIETNVIWGLIGADILEISEKELVFV